MNSIRIYTKSYCPYCDRAKHLLKSKGYSFEEIDVEHDEGLYEKLKTQTGHRTVPQIFIGDHFVGGFTDMKALDDEGKLDELIRGATGK